MQIVGNIGVRLVTSWSTPVVVVADAIFSTKPNIVLALELDGAGETRLSVADVLQPGNPGVLQHRWRDDPPPARAGAAPSLPRDSGLCRSPPRHPARKPAAGMPAYGPTVS